MTTQTIPLTKTILQPSPLPIPGQKDATYKTALILVAQIDEGVTKGNRHYYNRAGELLTTLDQVVIAIINDNLRV